MAAETLTEQAIVIVEPMEPLPAGLSGSDLSAHVFAEIERRIDQGMESGDAADEVLALVIGGGYSAQWLQYRGSRDLQDFWREWNRIDRSAVLTGNNRRRKPVVALREEETIFDVRWPVKSGFKRLGDMTAEDLGEQERYYRTFERSYRNRAEAFALAGKKVKKGKTVEQSWDAEGLAAVFKNALEAV